MLFQAYFFFLLNFFKIRLRKHKLHLSSTFCSHSMLLTLAVLKHYLRILTSIG